MTQVGDDVTRVDDDDVTRVAVVRTGVTRPSMTCGGRFVIERNRGDSA